jgi:DnaJ-domain-containing protein 1
MFLPFQETNMQDAFREAQQKLTEAAAQMMYAFFDNLLKGSFDDPVVRLMADSMGLGKQPPGNIGLDPYRVLGLDKSAPDEEVKRRYRELARKLHPDTAEVKGTEFLFQVVNAAYEQISQERRW